MKSEARMLQRGTRPVTQCRPVTSAKSIYFYMPDIPADPCPDREAVQEWMKNFRRLGVDVVLMLHRSLSKTPEDGTSLSSSAVGVVADIRRIDLQIVNAVAKDIRLWLFQSFIEHHPLEAGRLSPVESMSGLFYPYEVDKVVEKFSEIEDRLFDDGLSVHNVTETWRLDPTDELAVQNCERSGPLSFEDFSQRVENMRNQQT